MFSHPVYIYMMASELDVINFLFLISNMDWSILAGLWGIDRLAGIIRCLVHL